MAIAHVCLGCGFDLARVRAVREPHYGWPLVRCPHCETCSVRRRHPLQRGWRSLLRLDWALSMLLIQIALLGAMLALTWMTAFGLYIALTIHFTDHPVRGLPWIAAITLVVAPLITGAWLTAAYSHWKPRWRVWLAWALLVLIPLNVLPIFAMWGTDAWTPIHPVTSNRLSMPELMAMVWTEVSQPLIAIFAAMIAISPAGVPLGKLWLLCYGRLRCAQTRRRRRRLRAARRT